jgi:toxin secretion/phage lysis holin
VKLLQVSNIKIGLCAFFGGISGYITSLFGGWDFGLQTLVYFMIADFLSGWMLAGVFHKSQKTENGKLESNATWKGLCRKGTTLFIVLIATRLDLMNNTTIVRDSVISAYCFYEALSIVENASLMGLPVPTILKSRLEILAKK